MFGRSKKSTSANSGASSSSSSSASAAKKKEEAMTEEILRTYAPFADENDPEKISIEGIGRFGEELGMDPASDVRLLVLLWKLGSSQKPGSITKEEFLSGMKRFGTSTLEDVRQKIPSLDPGFLERNEFREFYRFVFQFSREGTHKTIEKEIICGLMPIVLDRNRAPHLEHFLQFLEVTSQTVITLDQWDSFLQFNESVDVSLSQYNDDAAWPLLLDEYVEWRRTAAEKK